MNSVFKYSLLQYVHSQFLAERLNIGILFYFPSERKLLFRKLDRLNQLKAVYPSFPKETFEKYLTELHDGAIKLSSELDLGPDADLKELADRNFIVKESAPLQFSEPKTAVLYDDTDAVAEDYVHLYEEGQSKIDSEGIKVS